MHAIHAFMERIIDYAGLFPPAQLPLPTVVQNFARYRGGPRAALLSRIICPARRLDEFAEQAAALFATGAGRPHPWRVAALGRGGDDADAFLSGLGEDLAAITTLVTRFDGKILVDAYECRPPAATVADADALHRLADRTALAIDQRATGEIRPFFEIGFAGDWTQTMPAAVAALAAHNRTLATPMCRPAGVKIRTGGATAKLIPSTEQLARLLHACHRNRVRFKATAGLHHPLRHHNTALDAKLHGFFNVFGAAALARVHDLDASAIQEILENENADNFRFDADGFTWRQLRVTSAQIADTRRDFAGSFGSCSIDEPVDDLDALGLLADAVSGNA